MPFHCGRCERVIYNRRRVTCEFCGAPIPAGQQLSPAQRAAIETLKANETRAHRAHMSRGEAAGGGDGFTGSVYVDGGGGDAGCGCD
ncbi:MAG TPA: hypothetical protein VEA69_15355 [Tepidisphaeraceae bacterium]|nr:hypothetical protein [Tepidisphaeraceae bacterium]